MDEIRGEGRRVLTAGQLSPVLRLAVLNGSRVLEAASGSLEGIAVVWMTGADEEVSHPAIAATLRRPLELDTLEQVVPAHVSPQPVTSVH